MAFMMDTTPSSHATVSNAVFETAIAYLYHVLSNNSIPPISFSIPILAKKRYPDNYAVAGSMR